MLLATRVLVVPVWGSAVPVFRVLPLVAHPAGSPQMPFGAMWSLQKFVEFITTKYSLHKPGGF